MKTLPEAVENRRRVLEEEHGGRFLTVNEAARLLGISPTAVYINPDRYPPTRYESSVFIAAECIEAILAARDRREFVEIQGVEHVDGIGRSDVTRYLCLPCRRFYRTREGFQSHDCCEG